MVLKQQFRTAGSSFRAECQASFGIHRVVLQAEPFCPSAVTSSIFADPFLERRGRPGLLSP